MAAFAEEHNALPLVSTSAGPKPRTMLTAAWYCSLERKPPLWSSDSLSNSSAREVCMDGERKERNDRPLTQIQIFKNLFSTPL